MRTAFASAGIAERANRRLRTGRGRTEVIGLDSAGSHRSAVGAGPAVFEDNRLAVGPVVEDAVPGDGPGGGDHHQRMAGARWRQPVPSRCQHALLLRVAGVAARHRNPRGVQLVRQRNCRAVDTRLAQRERTSQSWSTPGIGLLTRIASATIFSGNPSGENPTGPVPPSGPDRSRNCRERGQEAGVGIRFDQNVIGESAAPGERPDVGSAA